MPTARNAVQDAIATSVVVPLQISRRDVGGRTDRGECQSAIRCVGQGQQLVDVTGAVIGVREARKA